MAANTVQLVSEDAELRDSLSKLMVAAGLVVDVLPSIQAWLQAPGPVVHGCVVLDAGLADVDGRVRLDRLAANCRSRAVLAITERGDVPMVVLAIRHGAAEILQKPLREQEFLDRVRWILFHRADSIGEEAS
ncbi:response regulator [Dokdonella sp.]|uniref:response regulator n=1 Tax=Dokdonella sp. TaxID=2291710 RepID=UPI0035299E7D